MREAVRRQMLADMGITVWRLRGGRVAAPPPSALAATPHGPDRRPASIPAPRISTPPRDAVPEPGVSARRTGAARSAPWSALSLVLDDVVVLVDGASSKRDLRLAGDILAAATGDWRKKPATRHFRWPPEVTADNIAAADDGARAFNAFVDKDVDDHRIRLMICTAGLAPRLKDGWPDCRRIEIPGLDVLGREGDAKRALWRALQEVRR